MFAIPPTVQLVIFDLDDTLRPRYQHMFDDCVKQILLFLHENGIKIGLVSLNPMGREELFFGGILHLFDHVHTKKFDDEYLDENDKILHESNGKRHLLLTILQEAGVKPEHALFFDDNIIHFCEGRNLHIKSVCVKSTVTWRILKDGLDLFKIRRMSH